jgi:hypothetical protein
VDKVALMELFQVAIFTSERFPMFLSGSNSKFDGAAKGKTLEVEPYG